MAGVVKDFRIGAGNQVAVYGERVAPEVKFRQSHRLIKIEQLVTISIRADGTHAVSNGTMIGSDFPLASRGQHARSSIRRNCRNINCSRGFRRCRQLLRGQFCSDSDAITNSHSDSDHSDGKADALLAQMTQAEKLQMVQGGVTSNLTYGYTVPRGAAGWVPAIPD